MEGERSEWLKLEASKPMKGAKLWSTWGDCRGGKIENSITLFKLRVEMEFRKMST